MNAISKSMKWFTIVVIAVLVIGMTLLGVFGLNDTVDFKESYEVQVSVDQTYDVRFDGTGSGRTNHQRIFTLKKIIRRK